MKIGVIGAFGFIGKAFIKSALKTGNEIIAWDRKRPEEDYGRDGFQYYGWENGKLDHMEDLIQCDGILLLAAKRYTEGFSLNDYFDNIKIASDVLQFCSIQQLKNIILLSSTSVYSDTNIPWKEDLANVALNLYGASKLAVDDLAQYYNTRYDMHIKSLRLAQVVGLEERKGYLINTFLDRALQKLPLCIYGTGKGRRQYIYIKDVISAIFAAFMSEKGGIYNIGMKDTFSVCELAEIINVVFENENNLEWRKDQQEDLQCRWMDVNKAQVDLKWKANYTMETALRDIKKCIIEELNERKVNIGKNGK